MNRKATVTPMRHGGVRDAIALITECVDREPTGLILVEVAEDGNLRWMTCGDIRSGDLALLGLSMCQEALGGGGG